MCFFFVYFVHLSPKISWNPTLIHLKGIEQLQSLKELLTYSCQSLINVDGVEKLNLNEFCVGAILKFFWNFLFSGWFYSFTFGFYWMVWIVWSFYCCFFVSTTSTSGTFVGFGMGFGDVQSAIAALCFITHFWSIGHKQCTAYILFFKG